jgi:hypothetical protein
MVKTLSAHVFAQDTSVGGQPRNRDTEVLVDFEDLQNVDAPHANTTRQCLRSGATHIWHLSEECKRVGPARRSHLSLVIRQI